MVTTKEEIWSILGKDEEVAMFIDDYDLVEHIEEGQVLKDGVTWSVAFSVNKWVASILEDDALMSEKGIVLM